MRIQKATWVTTIFSALALTLAAPMAKATLVIEYSTNGTTWTTISNSGDSYFNFGPATYGGITFTGFAAGDNVPGGIPSETSSSGFVSIVNSTAATKKLYLSIVGQGFLSPTAPPELLTDSSLNGHVTVGNVANAITLLSCVDHGSVTTACQSSTYTAPAITPPITTTNSNYSGSSTTPINSLAAPYSIEQLLTITLGPGGNITQNALTQLTPVPEPGSILLLGTALFFGSRAFMRKRRRT